MLDIGAILEEISKKNKCSILYALLILLGEKEDVCLLQSKSQQ